jgi:membrane protease YdiL (CAAX protease family)
MMKKYKPALAIAVFYLIAITLRYLATKTSMLSGVESDFLKVILQGIGPAVGTLVACILFRIKMEMGLKGNFKNYIIPLSIFWIFPVLLIGAVAYFTNGTLPFVAITTVLIYGLLEEIGWRGFLQQLLQPLPKFASLLLITALWFVWHLNFELSISNLLLFFGILLFGSWGMGVVADKTKSLLSVAAFHSLFNFFTELNTQKIIILITLAAVWVLSIIYLKKKYRYEL